MSQTSGSASAPSVRKKRILVVSQHYWPENFRINDIVDGFIADGIEVDVLCGLPNYPLGEWFPGYRYTGPRRETHAGATLFRSGEIRRKGNTSLRILLNYCSFPLYSVFNLPRLRERQYDAVFCYETSPVLMILPAIVYAKTHRVPLTTYVLDLWPDNLYSVLPVKNRLLRSIAYRVSRWHYRRCDKLVAMSDAQAEVLRRMCQKKGKLPQITVIPQYSEDFYAEDMPDAELENRFGGRFNILFAGNISPAQDLENLVRAVARLRQTPGGEAIQVLLLGDGMSKNELEAFVQDRGLTDVFRFLGSVPPQDIPRWTHIADALFAGLAPSENLSLTVPAKIASYMAAGRPMLVACGGEGERAAQQSGAALVSPPGDDTALAANIQKLMATPNAERMAMGTAGRQYYRQHYRRSTLLRKLQQFILGTV